MVAVVTMVALVAIVTVVAVVGVAVVGVVMLSIGINDVGPPRSARGRRCSRLASTKRVRPVTADIKHQEGCHR
jgi:hypothetical protein